MAKKLWYSIKAQAQADKPVEIRIYAEIGFWGTTAEAFVAELDAAAASGADILVSLNSPGGDVFDAFTIYNALRRYAGRVTTRVDGVAASAASLVAMAGDQLVMPDNAQLMIHNAWVLTGGTAEDLRKTAEMMDKIRDGVVAAYARKSGLEADKLVEMMDATTWMTALEAQALGFCDVIEDPIRLQMSSDSAAEVLRKHKNLPAEVAAMLDEQDAAVPASAPQADVVPSEPATNGPDASLPTPASQPQANATQATAVVAHVYAACRTAGVAHLAEGVLLSSGVASKEQADARIAQAAEIAGVCLAAKMADKAAEFVAAGLSVDQARARLFDAVTAASEIAIDNTQRPDANPVKAGPALSITNFYEARAAARRRAS